MPPQRQQQHHMREMLGDEKAAGLRLAQLPHHPLDRPSQRGLIRFVANVRDGRQQSEEHAGLVAADGEATADQKEIAAAIVRGDATESRWSEDRVGVYWRDGEVAGETKGAAGGQHKAVALLDAHRIANVVDGEPAAARNDGVALDKALVASEPDGPRVAGVKAGRHVAAWFEQ